jgi:hypothetical protein
MTHQVSIQVGPPEKNGQRIVVATLGNGEWTDKFDVCDAFRRSKFRDAVISRFSLDESAHELLESSVMAAADAEDADREPIERLSFAELRAAHPHLHKPVVDGLLRAGEVANIISTSKVGKSWLVYDLALSIITGRPWLDRFATSPGGKVLIVDNELHAPTLAHRIPTVADALSIPAEQYDGDLEVMTLRGQLRSLPDLATDLESVRPGEFKCIVLDAKYRFSTGESENDNAAEAQFYNMVDQIAAHTGAAIVLVHHSSKGSQSDKRVTDVGAGAGAQSRATDCHLILREHEDDGIVVLDAAVRSFAPVEPVALRWQFPVWVPADDVDPGKLKGRLSGQEQRQAEKDKEGTDAILAALLKGPATNKSLQGATAIGRERLDRLLSRLLSDGHVTSQETKIRGNRCYEYQLVSE